MCILPLSAIHVRMSMSILYLHAYVISYVYDRDSWPGFILILGLLKLLKTLSDNNMKRVEVFTV